jgi:hypothetical protein
LIRRWRLTFKGTLAGRGGSPESVRDGALQCRLSRSAWTLAAIASVCPSRLLSTIAP